MISDKFLKESNAASLSFDHGTSVSESTPTTTTKANSLEIVREIQTNDNSMIHSLLHKFIPTVDSRMEGKLSEKANKSLLMTTTERMTTEGNDFYDHLITMEAISTTENNETVNVNKKEYNEWKSHSEQWIKSGSTDLAASFVGNMEKDEKNENSNDNDNDIGKILKQISNDVRRSPRRNDLQFIDNKAQKVYKKKFLNSFI